MNRTTLRYDANLRYFAATHGPIRPPHSLNVTGRTQVTDSTSAAGDAAPRSPQPTLISYTHWMYALHALSALIGVLSAAFIATAFVFGLPSIIAIIMNYVKREEARGTWLEGHFSWQRRTFWFALLWVAIVSILSLPLFLILIGFFTFGLGIAIIGLWVIYRVARGWLRLRDGKPIAA